MPIETAPFVGSLVPTNPANADPVQQGSDQLRLIKSAIKASFPNINGAVTANHTVLSGIDARATALETNRARRDVADTFAARMTFTVGADAGSFRRGGAELEPVGTIHMWLTGTPDDGYLLLNGQAVSRTTYAALFAKWGTTFGAGDGTTTFGLPNAALCFAMMAGSGVALGSTGGSLTPSVTVVSGGAHTHTGTTGTNGSHSHGGAVAWTAITPSQMPSHTHGVTDPGHSHVWGGLPGAVYTTAGGSGNTVSAGNSGNLGYTNFSLSPAGAGISIDYAGSGEGHSHAITPDGAHSHGFTTDSGGAHTHTASVASSRPPYFAFNFIVRAL